jgi:hypothetical protein
MTARLMLLGPMALTSLALRSAFTGDLDSVRANEAAPPATVASLRVEKKAVTRTAAHEFSAWIWGPPGAIVLDRISSSKEPRC